MASSYPTPKSPTPWPNRIQNTRDIITPGGNRKGSIASITSFETVVTIHDEPLTGRTEPPPKESLPTKELNSPVRRRKIRQKSTLLSIWKCGMEDCKGTTFQIDSPINGCDKRLERFRRFITKQVDDKHVNDSEIKNGPRWKVLSRTRQILQMCKKMDREWDVLFEVRVAEVDIKKTDTQDGEIRWTSNFFLPRWWDPTKLHSKKKGMKFIGFRRRSRDIGWKIFGTLGAWTGHLLCKLEPGSKNCSAGCTEKAFFKLANFKDFRLVANVEKMVLTMKCQCENKSSVSETLEVYLYERTKGIPSQKSKKDADDDLFIGQMTQTMDYQPTDKTSPKSESPPATCEEEAGKATPKAESGNGTRATSPLSLKDDRISRKDFGTHARSA
ncbi:hypothetical protein NHQ30_001260 [Ciborinia camelliae]|nr:hypothetical protein NHQ30_001260 [Ciborinia camelliae]